MPQAKSKSASTARQPYLKSKNSVYLCIFIGTNLAIFLSLFVSKGFNAASIDQFWQRVTAKDGIIAACLPILAIVLSGVVGDSGKARLVFWRWRNPLPGCRAFTELLGTDPRIDIPALKRKLGELPQDPQTQNAVWYRIYKEHSSDVKISEAHRIYLLTRDMATLAALFIILLSLGTVAGGAGWKTTTLYSLALIAQYLLVARSAKNYGTRFVLNVLSEESQTNSGSSPSPKRMASKNTQQAES